MRHRAYVIPLLLWVQVVEDKHVRIIHSAAFPLTLFRTEILIKPSSISQGVFTSMLIVTSRVSLIVLAVNQLFACAAVPLQSIFSRCAAMKLARVFNDFAAAALLQHTGLRNRTNFCHRTCTS
jgi:hypothetical protein